MVVRYISANKPETLSAYFGRLRGTRMAIISGPLFTGKKWFVWYTCENDKVKNIDLED